MVAGVVFFGLLALFFGNSFLPLPDLLPDDSHRVKVAAFLNVFSVSAVMCSLGARVVIPN